MRNFPYGEVIFCDDIRIELGNKPSFMGVYTDHLIFDAVFPVTLPKLCLFVGYADKIDAPPKKVVIQVHLPGGNEAQPAAMMELPLYEVPKEPPRTVTGRLGVQRNTRFIFTFTPLVIAEPGLIRVVAVHNDEKDGLDLGRLDVANKAMLTGTPVLGNNPTT